MIELDDVIDAYLIARKNKRKSSDQVEFEMHWERECVRLYNDIVNQTFIPTAYTFLVSRPKWREIFAYAFRVRVIHHYIDMRLRPIIESQLTPYTYNNRVGFGQIRAVNELMDDILIESNGYTEDCWIFKLDLKGCFPNILKDVAYKKLEDLVNKYYNGKDKDELIYMLKVCVYTDVRTNAVRKTAREQWCNIDDSKTLFNKPSHIGMEIGSLLSQAAVSIYFEDVHRFLQDRGYKFKMFVDDIVVVTKHKEEFLKDIEIIRQILGNLGATLNENKFYCQHYSKGVEFLGYHLKNGRVYCNNRTINFAIESVKKYKPDLNRLKNFLSTINSYLGLIKGGCGYNNANRVLNAMNKGWLEYVTIENQIVRAKEEFKENNLIIKNYDTTRKTNQATRVE